MRDLRVQYFLTYCVIGAVLPYASLLFKQAGLSDLQIGNAWAIWRFAVLLSPVLVPAAARGAGGGADGRLSAGAGLGARRGAGAGGVDGVLPGVAAGAAAPGRRP